MVRRRQTQNDNREKQMTTNALLMNQKLDNLMKPHRTWDDVIGNKVAVARLKAMLAARRPQPLLITGEYGTGKTALATLYAQYFMGADADNVFSYAAYHNCADGEDSRASFNDVKHWFDTDSYCGHRVILFDEADMMTAKSQRYAATRFNKECRGQLYILMAKKLPSDVGMRQRLTHIELLRLNREERVQLIHRVWRDERAAKILGGLSEARQADFIAAVNKWELDVPRNIYNALDALALGIQSADDCVTSNTLR